MIFVNLFHMISNALEQWGTEKRDWNNVHSKKNESWSQHLLTHPAEWVICSENLNFWIFMGSNKNRRILFMPNSAHRQPVMKHWLVRCNVGHIEKWSHFPHTPTTHAEASTITNYLHMNEEYFLRLSMRPAEKLDFFSVDKRTRAATESKMKQ